MSSIIEVNNLSKSFVLLHESEKKSYVALRDVVAGKAKKLFSFPQKIRSAKTENSSREIFWALKDVCFDIYQGERVGIIGRNGAGKSTLLKILSRITEPTNGRITMRGKVASLLEVGTGFHPELTGRENIYLNGAILGMSRASIKRKFDEIVDFAEVEKFLDTPVKRYSSGMYVRLAFAVAAHLEPEILIVDEVLAVGDAQFQKKCLGKMEEVSKGEGRTVLFVSHNMGSIKQLCSKGILLNKGKIEMIGTTSKVINAYTNFGKTSQVNEALVHKEKSDVIRIESIEIEDIDASKLIKIFAEIIVKVTFTVINPSYQVHFFLLIRNEEGEIVQSIFQKDFLPPFKLSKKEHAISIKLGNTLYPGQYQISVGAFTQHQDFADWVDFQIGFEVSNFFMNGNPFDLRLGNTTNFAKWEFQ